MEKVSRYTVRPGTLGLTLHISLPFPLPFIFSLLRWSSQRQSQHVCLHHILTFILGNISATNTTSSSLTQSTSFILPLNHLSHIRKHTLLHPPPRRTRRDPHRQPLHRAASPEPRLANNNVFQRDITRPSRVAAESPPDHRVAFENNVRTSQRNSLGCNERNTRHCPILHALRYFDYRTAPPF
jgi:hypothetical protein